ncbi:MAG: AAA family ATPase, partial [Desulfobacca sp.]|uniref:AAA family ATPase n=1 Tax=Desulfobacca sp. TaxID=2067990 RepID=UPI004049FC2D
MIKRISLENFMAHAATSLELSPGVTVIAGPNNIGKSAIVEALRHLLYNPAPKQVIRHGARETVVRLELDSGDSITWRRTDNRAAYILEQPGQPPVPYYKFGREVPADIRSLLRLEQVVTDTGRAIDIHVGNQRDPIFLLDEPGSHAAGFFAASSEADYLLKMQQALKRRREEASREQTRLQAELAELAAGLAHLAPLADLDLRLQEAEALYDVIAATVRRLPLWQDLHRDLAETTARLQGAQAVAGVLAGLQSPPALVATAGLAQLLAALEDTSRQMAQETLRQEVLAQVWQPPALAETAALAETVQASQDLQEELAVAHAQKGVLAALQQP